MPAARALTRCPPVPFSGVVLKVLFHPKQLLLFSAGDDAEVRVWDLVTKECVAVFKVGTAGAAGAAASGQTCTAASVPVASGQPCTAA